MSEKWMNRATAVLTAALAGGGLAAVLAAAPASAQVARAAPGLTPGVATITPADRGTPVADLAYTAADGSVYVGNVLSSVPLETALGGRLIGGPAVTFQTGSNNGRLAVFGRGTDNALWWDHQTSSGSWTGWRSLGGGLTSKPGAATYQAGGTLTAAARGTDAAVWQRSLTASGWSRWKIAQDPGVLLPGTAPALAYDPGGHLIVAVVGMDHHAYLEPEGTDFGFNDLGGQTISNPAVTVVDGTAGHPDTMYAVVFVRGTDNALRAKQVTLPLTMSGPPVNSGGWQSLGGRLTSGIAAQTATGGSYTYVFALGTDARFWMRIGAWPSLGPWQRA